MTYISPTSLVNSTTTEKSLLDVVPEAMLPYIERIPQEYLEMTETELRRTCYPPDKRMVKARGKAAPESVYETDCKLRSAFWNEYDRATTVGRRMQAQFIFGQTVHGQNFYKRVCSDPKRLAWIICPPGDYMAKLSDLLSVGILRLKEIFEIPIATQACRCHYKCQCTHPEFSRAKCKELNIPIPCTCGPKCICPMKYDPRVADIIVKALAMVEMRVKGAVIQKVDERRLNVNLFGKATPEQLAQANELPVNMEEVDKRLAELEAMTDSQPLLQPATPHAPEHEAIDAEFTDANQSNYPMAIPDPS